MATYEWSEEQRRGLTFGSTVEIGGERHVVDEDACPIVEDGPTAFSVEWDGRSRIVDPDDVDPSTLLPPSIAWIRELAMEKLGAFVSEMSEGPEDPTYLQISTSRLAIEVWDMDGMDRFRVAVAAIVAIGNSRLGVDGER